MIEKLFQVENIFSKIQNPKFSKMKNRKIEKIEKREKSKFFIFSKINLKIDKPIIISGQLSYRRRHGVEVGISSYR